MDPWDATTHSSCSFESDELALSLDGEAQGRLQLVIKENNG